MNIIWKGSPFYTKGRGKYKPEAIVLHIMDGSLAGTDSWFNNKDSGVSAHYGVGKTGEIHQYVHEEDNAYHAGKVEAPSWSLLKPNVNPNLYTIGIEHEGHPADVWTEEMKKSSVALIVAASQRWGIPIDREHIIGHYQISGKRRANCPAVNKSIIDELIARAKGPTPKPNNPTPAPMKQIKVLVLQSKLADPSFIQSAYEKAAQLVAAKTGNELTIALDFATTDKQWQTVKESGYIVVEPMSILWEAKHIRPAGDYKFVSLVFNADLVVGEKPTNPYANNVMDEGRVLHQIPEFWYGVYETVLTEFFLHELCHNLFFMIAQVTPDVRDITHDWNGTQAANTVEYYLNIIQSLKPYWAKIGIADGQAPQPTPSNPIGEVPKNMKIFVIERIIKGEPGSTRGLSYELNPQAVAIVYYNNWDQFVTACKAAGKDPNVVDVVINQNHV